jgi:SAM-dependent methyltransferase
MIVKNTTIQNISKQDRLNAEHVIPTHCITNKEIINFLKSLIEINESKEVILYSIGCELVKGNKNLHLKKFLSEYPFKKININEVPQNEFDLLGSVYQYLNNKKENLEKGSFYTGREIAKDFVNNLDFTKTQTIIDIACGSGSFLFNSSAPPEQIFGIDNDPIAIMIAKFNFFIKFPNAKYPNIFCDDFFVWFSKNNKLKFDYLIGNPPYGATLDLSNINSSHIKSGESFSYFIEYGCKILKKDGTLKYLLPESVLNVKKHSDIRNFILNNTNLTTIKKYETKFSGVMSDLYMLELNLNEPDESLYFICDKSIKIPKIVFKSLKNNIFTYFTEEDVSIISKVKSQEKYTLINSIFGLGVVTGGNQEKLFDNLIDESEPIYTGKDVVKYNLITPRKYIVFDRSKLQQVAPDEIYRIPKKLIYKVINKHIKVAIDTNGMLTTNSANILIPNIEGFDIYTIMGFLNSNLYSYLNVKLFGGVNKVSKENLQSLPFPKISKKDNLKIKDLVIDAMQNGNDVKLQTYINQNIFGLEEYEINYINKFIENK